MSVARKKNQRQHKLTPKEIRLLADASRALADAAPPTFGPVTVELDPEFVALKKTASIAEILDAMRIAKAEPKRVGRPSIPNKIAILDAAALAKVTTGRYLQIAADWGLTRTQLIDLVRNNRTDFSRKEKELRNA